MLDEMGFSRVQARETVRSRLSPPRSNPKQNGDEERAVKWLFSHPDNMGEDEPLPASSSGADSAVAGAAAAAVTQLVARYRLRAFVSHKGPSMHSGHYVAHIRTEASWVLFNDEKVVRVDPESVRILKALAYLYVFKSDPPAAA